jgi:rod shape-determining protein MreB
LYLCKINIKKMGLFSLFTKEIAIDLGTANTVILYNDKVVVDEPSIIAIQRDTNEVLAVGKHALMMHGKTHENVKTIRPLRDGVIADFKSTELMLREFIKMAGTRGYFFPPALKNGHLYSLLYYRSGRTCRA